jgi:hypothetical protein
MTRPELKSSRPAPRHGIVLRLLRIAQEMQNIDHPTGWEATQVALPAYVTPARQPSRVIWTVTSSSWVPRPA